MQSIKQIFTIAGVLTTMFILPVKAEELVIWTRTNQPAEDKALKKIFAEFEAANPGVTIKMETRSVDEHKSSLGIASTSKAGPDIYYMWAGLGLGGEFVKAGLSAPLDEYYINFNGTSRGSAVFLHLARAKYGSDCMPRLDDKISDARLLRPVQSTHAHSPWMRLS